MGEKNETSDKQIETLQLFTSESTISDFKGDDIQVTQFSQALGLLLETGAVSVHESMRWTADRQQQTGVTSTTYTRINVHSETHK